MERSNKAPTLGHPHIELPESRGWISRSKKQLAREIKIDTALIALCSVFLGWVFFSLSRAFEYSRVIY